MRQRIEISMNPGNPFKRLWQMLRQVSGDDAYERYRAHHASSHADSSHGANSHVASVQQQVSTCGAPPLSRQQFFKLQQEEKWSRVSRCC